VDLQLINNAEARQLWSNPTFSQGEWVVAQKEYQHMKGALP